MSDRLLGMLVFALFVALAVEIAWYIRVRANAFTRKEVKNMALQKANKLSYVDPEITCDYCGSKINTQKYKVCPNCGAAYDKDKEWRLRHALEEKYVDETTDALIAAREQKAQAEAAKIRKHIRYTLIVTAILFVIVCVLLSWKEQRQYDENTYRADEDVNEFTEEVDDEYTPADYEVDGDGVIYDQDDIKITIDKFYLSGNQWDDSDDYDYYGNVRFCMVVENHRDEPVDIYIHWQGANGLCDERFEATSDYEYKKNSTVTVYEELEYVPYQQLENMIIDEISISTKQHGEYVAINEMRDPIVVKTTAKCPYHFDYTDRTLLYSNDQIDIYGWLSMNSYGDRGYRFAIVNKSDEDYRGLYTKLYTDDAEESHGINCFYEYNIPKGCTATLRGIYDSEDKDFLKRKHEVYFCMESLEQSEHNFETGKLDFSDLCQTWLYEEESLW
ncbi:MAG: zinc ribbon domain-containing protein [Lachnospiraceae bacterium]|nr:zinc ribbon domain-containing protein [Lachnospiraceae bacterium]